MNRTKKKWHVAFSVIPGGCFSGPLGELHNGCPADHKVVCAVPGTSLLSCPFSVLERSGGLRLVDEARAELEAMLVYVPCFNRLKEEWLRLFVCDLFTVEMHEERRFVCREGGECDALYVVTQGSVRAAVTDPDGGEREIAMHEKGAYFNDLALASDWDARKIKRCEATAQVRSRRAVCLALRWERFKHVAGHPGVKPAFSSAATTRLRATAEGNLTARAMLGNMTNRSYRSNATSVEEDLPEDLGPPPPLPWDPYAAPLGEPGGPAPTQLGPKGARRKAEIVEALRRSLVFEGVGLVALFTTLFCSQNTT